MQSLEHIITIKKKSTKINAGFSELIECKKNSHTKINMKILKSIGTSIVSDKEELKESKLLS